jgi:hypothetical protein
MPRRIEERRDVVALQLCDLRGGREPKGGGMQINEVSTKGRSTRMRRRNGPCDREMIRNRGEDGKFNSVCFTA